jgi:acyl-CoA thioesterase YciA
MDFGSRPCVTVPKRRLPVTAMSETTETTETPPDTDPAIRTIAMPADTNPHGDIFGGWLLCQMDLAGATVAVRQAGGRVVTVAITAMAFHRPVCVGDEVSCYGSVEKIGNTSIVIRIQSWARRGTGQTPIKVTEGLFTYVRVDADGKPQAITAS